jgi:CRP-like cAMP-binding protein
MFYAVVDAGTNIFQKDDVGSCFFIIEKGSVDISVDG